MLHSEIAVCCTTDQTAIGNLHSNTRRPRQMRHFSNQHTRAALRNSGSLIPNVPRMQTPMNASPPQLPEDHDPYSRLEAINHARQSRVPAAVSSSYDSQYALHGADQQFENNAGPYYPQIHDGGLPSTEVDEEELSEDGDEQEQSGEDDDDYATGVKSEVIAASRSKKRTSAQPRVKGEAKQPKKSSVPPLFADEVKDTNGNWKFQCKVDGKTQ